MNKNLKIYLYVLLAVILVLCAFGLYKYNLKHKALQEVNMCQDEALIYKLIETNVNPFSKFKYIKKRNEDCKSLLTNNRESALKAKKEEYCSYISSSTNSLTVLINVYVHEMYDRESASREFRSMTPLMTPYEYCPEYIDSMITLINLKKRLGL